MRTYFYYENTTFNFSYKNKVHKYAGNVSQNTINLFNLLSSSHNKKGPFSAISL